MVRALSEDLRVRVIGAVEAGASRREAAPRFGVSVSSAIRWAAVWRASGQTRAAAMGGDLRSGRIEAHEAFLLAEVDARPDVTLAELRERLWRERGLSVAISTLWRFFDRHRLTLKTYGPPRWQVGRCWLGSVVRKRIRRSGASAVAMMEIRASWSL